MNAAHLHLMVNHLPVTGLLFGLIFLLVAMPGRNKTLIKVSLWILVLVAVLTIPAYVTGGAAKEMMAGFPGISAELVSEPEESAEKAFIAVIGLGVIAALGLLVHRAKNRVSGIFLATIFLLTIITGVLMGGAANMGGEIRHPEIRDGAVLPATIESPDHNTIDNDGG